MFVRLPYDPVKDFAPITQILWSPLLLVANASVPANTLQDLAAPARNKPGALNYDPWGAAASRNWYTRVSGHKLVLNSLMFPAKVWLRAFRRS